MKWLEKLKFASQRMWKTHKVLTIVLILVLITSINVGIFSLVSWQQSKLPSKQHEIAFVKNVLPEKDVVFLEEVKAKVEAGGVEDVVYRQANRRQQNLINYYLKYRGEEGYHLYQDYLTTPVYLSGDKKREVAVSLANAAQIFSVTVVQEPRISELFAQVKDNFDAAAFEQRLKSGEIISLITDENALPFGYLVKLKGEEGYYLFTPPAGYTINVEILEAENATYFDIFLERNQLHAHNVASNPQYPFPTYIVFINLAVSFLFIYVYYRVIRSGGGFGRISKKGIYSGQEVPFEEVAGIDEAKEEFLDVGDFLTNSKKYEILKAKVPKGILLVGPPGVGKTLMAKALATKLKVPFFSLSGSEFVEMFVGVGAARVRDTFNKAKKNKPCIIFIDEIDAIGKKRDLGTSGGDSERQNTTNEIMIQMDGIESGEGVLVIGATNRPDILDEGFTRSGRFDRKIFVGYPDVKGREAILRVHTKNRPLAEDVDLARMAKSIPWRSSGADIANIVNEAAIYAGKRGEKVISAKDFQYARDKIRLGLVKKGEVVTDQEKKQYAYHEAGHALVVKLLPQMPPLNKVSILGRGDIHGVVEILPEKDQKIMTKIELLREIAFSMGSVAAEKEVFGLDNITTGARGDLAQATSIAMGMVSLYGMSEEFGPVSLKAIMDAGQAAPFTEKMLAAVRKINENAEATARDLIQKNREKLDAIAKALIEEEDIDGARAEKIIEEGRYPL